MRVPIRTILFSTDLSELANHALPYAVFLCRELGAKLYVGHVVDVPPVGIYGEAIVDPLGQQELILESAQVQIETLFKEEGLSWEPVITIGRPAEELLHTAGKFGVDLTVAATHGRSGIRRLLLGSVTQRLMRTLPCPILVVPSHESPDGGEVPPARPQLKRILVGYDFSSDSRLALDYGISLAQEFEAELHLVHVIEPSAYQDLFKGVAEESAASLKDVRPLLNERLRSLVPKDAENWCKPKTTLLAGPPHEEIVKYALLNQMDMIVLGVRGHGLIETVFVGSTTDRVMRQAPCPILAVRPKAARQQKD